MTKYDFEKMAWFYGCPTCKVGPGRYCRAKSGNRAKDMHQARTKPFREAYVAGYEDGWKDERDIQARLARNS